MSFEVVMLTPIVKRKFLIKEFFGFIKNHKSYGSLKFLSSEYFFSTSFQCSVCLGRGKAVICGEKIHFFPFFTRGSYFRGTKMVLISAEPYFRFVHFYAWFLFSREQNGSYFRAHIKNAKIWTREVLKRENEVRAKKWTFTVFDKKCLPGKNHQETSSPNLQSWPFWIAGLIRLDLSNFDPLEEHVVVGKKIPDNFFYN